MRGERSWIPLIALWRTYLLDNKHSSEWKQHPSRHFSIADYIISRLFRRKFPGQVFSHSTSNFPSNYLSPLYQHTSAKHFEATSPHHLCTDWDSALSTHQERHGREWSILGHATTEPSYVDPETGDNIWHALAKLALPRNKMLCRIQNFLSEDVDLNLPNKAGEYPLIAFIQNRPSFKPEDDETEAQRSEYLETLMWKDPRAETLIPNQINVNIRDRSGATALYHAAIRGLSDTVRSLIEAGANVNARLGNYIFAFRLVLFH